MIIGAVSVTRTVGLDTHRVCRKEYQILDLHFRAIDRKQVVTHIFMMTDLSSQTRPVVAIPEFSFVTCNKRIILLFA